MGGFAKDFRATLVIPLACSMGHFKRAHRDFLVEKGASPIVASGNRASAEVSLLDHVIKLEAMA